MTISITDKLLVDLIFVGISCGLYLKCKGLTVMKSIPTIVERGNRALTHDDVLKAVESLGCVFMGALYQMLSLSLGVCLVALESTSFLLIGNGLGCR